MEFYSYWRSSAAYRVRIALAVKGLPVEMHYVHLLKEGGQQRLPDYRLLNPSQLVPTLVDGDFSLSESSAICEYLQDRFGGAPLYPQDAQARARVRQVQAWLRSDLMALRSERSTEVVFYRPTPYAAKIGLRVQGTAEAPFQIHGVSDPVTCATNNARMRSGSCSTTTRRATSLSTMRAHCKGPCRRASIASPCSCIRPRRCSTRCWRRSSPTGCRRTPAISRG